MYERGMFSSLSCVDEKVEEGRGPVPACLSLLGPTLIPELTGDWVERMGMGKRGKTHHME